MGERLGSKNDHGLAETILSDINEAVIIHKDLEIVYANTPATRITGYSKNDLVGSDPTKYISETSAEKVAENYKKRKYGERVPDTYEIEIQHKNKETPTPVELSVSKTTFHDSEAMVVVLRDISHRKQIEEKYEKIHRAVKDAAEAIYITDENGTIEYVNDAFEEITGYTENQALGENPRILKSGEMGEGYYEELWETVTNGDSWEELVVNKRANGELYHAQQTITPIQDDNGNITSYVAIQSDVTEQIKQSKKLDMVTENLPGLIYQCEFDEKWPMNVVRGSKELSGYASETIENNDVYWGTDIIHPEDRDKVWETVQDAVEDNDPFTLVYRIITKNGEVKWVWERGQSTRDKSTGEIVLEGVILNVSERKKYENRVFETTRQLEVIGRILRHNLQNDMNVILGNAQSIKEQSSDEIKTRANKIDEVGQKLLETTSKEKMITRVLTDSDNPNVTDISGLIQKLTDDLKEQHPNAEIQFNNGDVLEATTSAHFTEAFTEVIENAITHSDKNTPKININIENTDNFVEVQITDNGPGIPKMEREVLTKDKIEPLYHGSGLGLWLVHIIMSESGGDIKFNDDPTGTTVRLQLPKPKSTTPP